MATNPPITIGPFTSVPAPGSGVASAWCQQISTYVAPTTWTDVTFTGTWVNLGGANQQNVQYRKIGDRVFFRGSMKSGVSGTSAFTLPVGFRPPTLVYQAVMCAGAVAGSYAVFNPANGTVSVTAPNVTQVSFDGASFSVSAT